MNHICGTFGGVKLANIKTVHFSNPVLTGEITVPGDKSISHRAVMLGSIAQGKTTITGFLDGEDCLRTIEIFKQLGVVIERNGTTVVIESPGYMNWHNPATDLYAGNSGTTARLLIGILAASNVTSTMTGDEYLSLRPMGRVVTPLREMGATIQTSGDKDVLPLTIKGGKLHPISYHTPVASAQIKSAVLFGGLLTAGTTIVTEDTVSRDHTEQMLAHFGADITVEDKTVSITGGKTLHGTDIHVPSDISSAAFLMVAASMIEGSSITFHNLGINPTRTGIIDVLEAAGASIFVANETNDNGELVASVTVSHKELKPMTIGGELIPRLIDELPIIALLATQANGQTIIRDAEELRVKETDRIKAVAHELTLLGASVEETADGLIINGPTPLKGFVELDSYGDHRLGMMAAIAALLTDGPVTIKDYECINISYPTFFRDIASLVK